MKMWKQSVEMKGSRRGFVKEMRVSSACSDSSVFSTGAQRGHYISDLWINSFNDLLQFNTLLVFLSTVRNKQASDAV